MDQADLQVKAPLASASQCTSTCGLLFLCRLTPPYLASALYRSQHRKETRLQPLDVGEGKVAGNKGSPKPRITKSSILRIAVPKVNVGSGLGWGVQWESLCLVCPRASRTKKQIQTKTHTHTHTPSHPHFNTVVSLFLFHCPHEGFLRNENTSLPTASVCLFVLSFVLSYFLCNFYCSSG